MSTDTLDEQDTATHTDATVGADAAVGVDAGAHVDPFASTGAWLLVPASYSSSVLRNAGFDVLDSADGALVAVVSTRTARNRLIELVTLGREAALPVLVLTHPGGESNAVEAMKAGADLLVAEGDHDSLARVAEELSRPAGSDAAIEGDDERGGEEAVAPPIVEAYDARLVSGGKLTEDEEQTADPITGLPSGIALVARLSGSLETSVRILSFRVVNFPRADDRLSPDATAMLARRLARAYGIVCDRVGELFDLGSGSYVLLAPNLTDEAAEILAHKLAGITEVYTPDIRSPLFLAAGHAGPECGADPLTLRELAGRAETEAARKDGSAVLGARELVGLLATATELEVTLKLIALVTARQGMDRESIAKVAEQIAVQLGVDSPVRVLTRFVAHVADIGMIRTPSDEAEPDWKLHPAQSASFLSAAAGPLVARAVRHTHEHFDGTGFPDALSGSAIPLPSRICAVAEALVAGGYDTELLTAGSSSRFDPTVCDAALDLLRQGVITP